MIGKLFGIIDCIKEDMLILNVGGIGYIVYCSAKTLQSLPAVGEKLSLIIETKIAEDRFELYGFHHEHEQFWFRLLNKINGISAKTAMSILSALTPEQITLALAQENKRAFTQISGIGPKLALRILTELKDYAPLRGETALVTSSSPLPSLHQDAMTALINLGYSQQEAFQAVDKVIRTHPEQNLAEHIRLALRSLVKEKTL